MNLIMHHSQLSDSLSIDERMRKPCRYTPQEMKERIEKYRLKRTKRNFKKTIKVSQYLFEKKKNHGNSFILGVKKKYKK